MEHARSKAPSTDGIPEFNRMVQRSVRKALASYSWRVTGQDYTQLAAQRPPGVFSQIAHRSKDGARAVAPPGALRRGTPDNGVAGGRVAARPPGSLSVRTGAAGTIAKSWVR